MIRYKFKIVLLLFLLIICTSCSDEEIQFVSSGSFILNNNKNVNYTTYGNTNFGQYLKVGVGYSNGGGGGSEVYNFRGVPEGEIFAIWETYKEDLKGNAFSGSEKYYYAYKLYPDYNTSKSLIHKYYSIYLSYGYLHYYEQFLAEEQKKDAKYLTNPSGVKKYQFGRPDYFYYKVKSINSRKSYDDLVYKTPIEKFGKIKAIRITKEQYEYMVGKVYFYLDEAPNVTKEQLEYMKKQSRK